MSILAFLCVTGTHCFPDQLVKMLDSQGKQGILGTFRDTKISEGVSLLMSLQAGEAFSLYSLSSEYNRQYLF